MFFRKRGARKRDPIAESRLVRMDHVYLSLDEHRELPRAYRVLRTVHAEKDFGFMIQVCLRTVQVFSQIVRGKSTAGECDDVSRRVAYWEHEPVTKSVVVRAWLPVSFFDESCGEKFRYRKPFES